MTSTTEHAVSRVPPEIWYLIFWEAVRPQDEIPLSESMGAQYQPPGFGALRLSGVCRKWRETAMAYKPLWSHITITWNTFDMERIEHYYQIAKGTEISLVLGEAHSNNSNFVQSCIYLKEMFREEGEIKRITCVLHYPTNEGITSFLEILPAAREVYYFRAASIAGSVQAMLPRHHCESVKKFLTDSAMVGYVKDVKLEEFTVSTSYEIPLHHWGGLVHPYIYPGSVETLQVVSIHGQIYEYQPKAVCPNIHTLRMSLHELVVVFLPCYKVPNLKKLEITSFAFPPETQWREVWQASGNVNVTCLVLYPMRQGHKEIINYLQDFTATQSLELRGSSVDPSLETIGNSGFPELRQLIIRSYDGNGRSIVDYLLRRRMKEQEFSVSAEEKLKVQLENCVSISQELLVLIRDFNTVGK